MNHYLKCNRSRQSSRWRIESCGPFHDRAQCPRPLLIQTYMLYACLQVPIPIRWATWVVWSDSQSSPEFLWKFNWRLMKIARPEVVVYCRVECPLQCGTRHPCRSLQASIPRSGGFVEDPKCARDVRNDTIVIYRYIYIYIWPEVKEVKKWQDVFWEYSLDSIRNRFSNIS